MLYAILMFNKIHLFAHKTKRSGLIDIHYIYRNINASNIIKFDFLKLVEIALQVITLYIFFYYGLYWVAKRITAKIFYAKIVVYSGTICAMASCFIVVIFKYHSNIVYKVSLIFNQYFLLKYF